MRSWLLFVSSAPQSLSSHEWTVPHIFSPVCHGIWHLPRASSGKASWATEPWCLCPAFLTSYLQIRIVLHPLLLGAMPPLLWWPKSLASSFLFLLESGGLPYLPWHHFPSPAPSRRSSDFFPPPLDFSPLILILYVKYWFIQNNQESPNLKFKCHLPLEWESPHFYLSPTLPLRPGRLYQTSRPSSSVKPDLPSRPVLCSNIHHQCCLHLGCPTSWYPHLLPFPSYPLLFLWFLPCDTSGLPLPLPLTWGG